MHHIEEKLLTEREKEYITLVGLGYKNSEIAKILCVSHTTVKKTLETVFLKLNAKNRSNAITIALLQNIITPEFIEYIKAKYNLT